MFDNRIHKGDEIKRFVMFVINIILTVQNRKAYLIKIIHKFNLFYFKKYYLLII